MPNRFMSTAFGEEVNAGRNILCQDNTVEFLDKLIMRSKEVPAISVWKIVTVYQVTKIVHHFNHKQIQP